jgi:hypothetical protein
VKQATLFWTPSPLTPLPRWGEGNRTLSGFSRAGAILFCSPYGVFFAIFASSRFRPFQNRIRSWNSNCRICFALVRRP